MTWEELLEDETWEGVSDKIELDSNGKVQLTQMDDKVREIQMDFMDRLTDALYEQGEIMMECAISNGLGVISPDLAFASEAFMEQYEEENPFRKSPELCIEIMKECIEPSILEQRIETYLRLGAEEVWAINPESEVQVYDKSGPIEKTKYGLELD